MTIEVNLEEILENALAEEDLEIREGTPTHDIFAKAGQNLFDKLANEMNRLSRQMTVADNPNNQDDDEIDALMGNFFVEREEGSPTTGVVRVYLSSPRDVSVSENERFFTGDGTAFEATSDILVTQDQMTSQTEGDLYYFDVEVSSSDPGTGAGEDILYMENEPAGFVDIETIEQPAGGTSGESNQELVDKAKKQIGIRDLVRQGSIFAQLKSTFPFIKKIQPIGFQDPEMHRDILGWLDEQFKTYIENNCDDVDEVPPELETYHVGMHADVYVEPENIQEHGITVDLGNGNIFNEQQENFELLSYVEVSGGDDQLIQDSSNIDNADYHLAVVDPHIRKVPISIISACVLQNLSGDVENQIENAEQGNCTLELNTVPDDTNNNTNNEPEINWVTLNDDDKMYSPRANYALKIKENSKGGTRNYQKVIHVQYQHVPEIVTVQNYFEDPENRIITSDLLAKHFVPTFIDIDVEYEGDLSQTEANNVLSELILNDKLQEESDVVGALYDNGAEFVNLDTLSIQLEVHNINGEIVVQESGEIDSELKLKSIADGVDKLTRRVQTFLPRDINATQV